MLPEQIRQAILTLHGQGRGRREISRILKVSRNTVRRVLRTDPPSQGAADDPRVQAIVALLPEIFRSPVAVAPMR